MCSGDGRAKRNRRVSWLISCKETRALGGAPPPALRAARAPCHPEGMPMPPADSHPAGTCARAPEASTPHLFPLAQGRAGTRPGPPSEVIRVGNKLRIPKGGCQMAQKILGARGRIQPCHQLGQCPGVAGSPRALGWQARGRAETRPVYPGRGHKRGAPDYTQSPLRSGTAVTAAGLHRAGSVPAPLLTRSRPRLRALSQASTLRRMGR